MHGAEEEYKDIVKGLKPRGLYVHHVTLSNNLGSNMVASFGFAGLAIW